jgi:hypothetical protein
MPELSLRAYAKHRGVSLRAVQKAIQSGRIRTTGEGKIDVEQADGDWQRNTAPRPQASIAISSPPRQPAPMVAPDPPRQEVAGAGPFDYARARAVHENYKARLAKMEFDKRSGKLVNSDEVQVAAFNKFRTFRDGMLNVPDRVSAVLAAESDPVKVHTILITEIRKALLEFADVANG